MPSVDNKKKSQQNKLLYIFLTTFFATLLILVYLATALTPNIDVDVPSEESQTTTSDTVHQDIDSRLKDIQQDDLAPTEGRISDESSNSDLFEQLKKMKEEAIAKQIDNEEIEIQNDEDPMIPEQIAKPKLASPEYKRESDVKAQSQPPVKVQKSTKMAKVYVGKYTDFDQAIKVQDALIKSGLATSPFIKNLGNYYVIQVGSFVNHQTAQNIAENLIENGYSARMLLE
ncbi:hypothetical protein IJE86_01040 [bacterium]|nr:hypothetical protein [bacterium]